MPILNAKLKSVAAMFFLLVAAVMVSIAAACPESQCPSGQVCCGDTCIDPSTTGCCDGEVPYDPEKYCCVAQ